MRGDKVAAATSSTSLYDNVAGGNQSQMNAQGKQTKSKQNWKKKHIKHSRIVNQFQKRDEKNKWQAQ